ncbi:hypothetical protein B0H14DRAFT_3524179 [Mycena olivaceomarginata]|nr:hypothetical protein B0H14DRAFT_3524179 [Mycena olivaceomarginata]
MSGLGPPHRPSTNEAAPGAARCPPHPTTLLAQKTARRDLVRGEVQQDDVQVGAMPLDLHPCQVLHRGPPVHPQQGEPEDTDDEGDTRGDEPALRVSATITKPTPPGALHADLYCADGAFDVANRPAEKALWTGPSFESLNPALNDAFEAYLRKRGVDGALAGSCHGIRYGRSRG